MTVANIRIVDDLMFPEGLRWHQGEIWFSDFLRRRVSSADMSGKVTERAFVSAQPSGLGFTPSGEPLVVGMFDRNLLRITPDGIRVVANAASLVGGPLNDMYVDARGRAYIGGFGHESMYEGRDLSVTTCLAFVDVDGSIRGEGHGLSVPNGIAGTRDGKTLIVAETFFHRLTAFDIAEDGSLSNKRLFADLGSYPPDGICIDAEGQVWVATFDEACVVRVREGGEITQVVNVGGPWATACALGGEHGRTLFCAVAETDVTQMRRGRSRGWIEALQVDVPAQ